MEARDFFAARVRYGGPRVVGNKSVLVRWLWSAQGPIVWRVAGFCWVYAAANSRPCDVSRENYRVRGSLAVLFSGRRPACSFCGRPAYGARPVATRLCFLSPARLRRPATTKKAHGGGRLDSVKEPRVGVGPR
jgi:hypothetical protein